MSLPERPQPPEGFQRPGIPGAGNLLDPAVRGELREQVQEAAQGAGAQVHGQNQPAPPVEPARPLPPSVPPRRTGPFPHGDVDLSFISANVPSEPIKPRRAKGGRRFYFLPNEQTASTSSTVPRPQSPAAPKPG